MSKRIVDEIYVKFGGNIKMTLGTALDEKASKLVPVLLFEQLARPAKIGSCVVSAKVNEDAPKIYFVLDNVKSIAAIQSVLKDAENILKFTSKQYRAFCVCPDSEKEYKETLQRNICEVPQSISKDFIECFSNLIEKYCDDKPTKKNPRRPHSMRRKKRKADQMIN